MSNLKKFLSNFDEDIVIAEHLDYAFVGLASTEHGYSAIYSTNLIVEQLIEEDCMDYDTAEEFMINNIISAYSGERSPIFVEFIPRYMWNENS